MKTIPATEAKNRFGEHFNLADNESLLIETRGLPTHLVFNAKTGIRLVLGAFADGGHQPQRSHGPPRFRMVR